MENKRKNSFVEIYNDVALINYNHKEDCYRLALQMAEEGIVLLKNNDGVLPIDAEKTAVFGRTQINTIKCGTGSAFF